MIRVSTTPGWKYQCNAVDFEPGGFEFEHTVFKMTSVLDFEDGGLDFEAGGFDFEAGGLDIEDVVMFRGYGTDGQPCTGGVASQELTW